jgi:hypothetical protein
MIRFGLTSQPVSQVKHAFRIVSPDEYDEAASSAPYSCPLRLTGDHRSGQQLLADAQSDSVHTIRSLANNPAGRALLAPLAAYIENLCTRLDPAGQPANTSRRDPSPPTFLHVHRPIALGPSNLILGADNPLLRFLAERLVGGALGRFIFNIGYDAQRIVRIATDMPERLASGSVRLVGAMQRMGLCAQASYIASPESPETWPPARTLAGDTSGGGGGGWGHEEEAMWEEEKEVGVMRVDLNPETQGRERLLLNSRFAEIWCRHRDECQAQFAAHEGEWQHTDLGLVCVFLMELWSGLTMTRDFYQRFCFGAGPNVRAVLACTTKQRVLNSAGQLVTVSYLLGC